MAEPPRIDLTCPECGTQYHLSPESAGKRMRCPNKLCGAAFIVPLEAEIAEPVDAEPAHAAVDSPEVLEAQIAGAEQQIETLPVEAIVTDTAVDALEAPRPDVTERRPSEAELRRKRRTRRQRRGRRIKSAAGLLLVLLAVASLALIPFIPWKKTADQHWAEAMQLFDEHRWSAFERGLGEFEREFPDDPRVEQIPFFLAMCRAGEDIYSTTGDPVQGLASVQQIFKDHRNNPAYEQYCVDLFKALERLIERFNGLAVDGLDLHKLALADEAHRWLQTVDAAIEDDWFHQRTLELVSEIEHTEQDVKTALARREAVTLLEQGAGPELKGDADEIYAKVERIFAGHPTLRDERELKSGLTKAYRAEALRVRFHREDPADQPPFRQPSRDPGQENTMVVVWGDATRDVMVWSDAIGYRSPPGKAEVVLAVARGILHAFDAANGRLLWARRLGIDSHRLPGRIAAAGTSPAALIAVSTEDNTLLALGESSGELLWQYPNDGNNPGRRDDIVAGLTIVGRPGRPNGKRNGPSRVCGMLPTADGEIHVLELAKGRRLGRYVTGQPMTTAGTYDPRTGLAFFPADTKRMYAIDPAAIDVDPAAIDALESDPCRSILFTDHASGALRWPPVVVGQYLIVSEASELEHTRLQVFRLTPSGFPDPAVKPKKELTLEGWAWFRPHCTPDRITLVTDRGRLGIFGLNLDNTSEALYRIVPDCGITRGTPYRSLAVHAQEHLLWIMSGGLFRKLSVDVVHNRVHLLWQDGGAKVGVGGIPIHQAQADRFAEHFFLATMSVSGWVHRFTAVKSEDGTRRWQRQLGVVPLGDPLPWEGGVLLIDRTGRTLALRPGMSPLAGGSMLPQEAVDGQVMRLDGPTGMIYLVATTDGATRLAVRRIILDPRAPQPEGPEQAVLLEDRLHGRPCICGKFLVVPYADGRLGRVPLPWEKPATSEYNVKDFFWAEQRPGPNRAEVYALGPEEVLLIDGRRRIRRLRLGVEKRVLQWKTIGEIDRLPAPLRGQPLLTGDHLFVFDAEGTLYRLDVKNDFAELGKWPWKEKVTRGPFLRGDYLLAIAEQRRLLCMPLRPPEGVEGPLWTADGFRGRICGLPLVAGETLLVADNGRRITGIRLSDGQMLWKTGLPMRVGPAATPVPCANNRMLLPLADGTLLELPIPTQQLAEASP